MIQLQIRLADRIRELQEALAHVNQLKGIIPICAQCKKIRDDQNYWQRVEKYREERRREIHPRPLPRLRRSGALEADQMAAAGDLPPTERLPSENEANP
jgi:hypothetical protein